jgi:SulP family sulfate permease
MGVCADARQERRALALCALWIPKMLRGMERLGWSEWLPREHWFPEEDTEFSATLRAVRKAYELAGERSQGEAVVYYLV